MNVLGSGSFTASSFASWLKVDPIAATAPATLSVTADPAGFSAGPQTGTITIFDFSGNRIDITATMNVNSIGVNPSSLQFAYQVGAPAPAAQTLALTGSATYNAAAFTNAGGNWLTISTTGIAAGTSLSGTSPGTLNVSVNSTGLAAGSYSGTVRLTPTSGGGTTPIDIPVTFKVTPSPPITVSPASASLYYQIGGSNNSPQQVITLSNSGNQPVDFSFPAALLTFDPNPAGKLWFTVKPLTGTIPANGSAQVTIAYDTTITALQTPGVYTGKATLSTPGGTPQTQDIPVKMTVSGSPLLSVSASTLNYTYQVGTATPSAQTITINSTNGASTHLDVAVNTNNTGNWLSTGTPTAGTPFAVTVDPTGLAPGNYTGTVTVTSPGAANSPVTITVNLKVTNDPIVVASFSGCSTANLGCPMIFPVQTGQAAPAQQQVRVTSSTGAALKYSAATDAASCGGNWLQLGAATTGNTDGAFTVSVSPGGITAPAKCDGNIVITATNASTNAATPNSPLTIPVTMYVSTSALLVVSPSALTFNAQVQGAIPPQQTLTLASTSATDQLTFTVTPDASATWLAVSPPTAGANGTQVNVLAFPGNFSAGVYKANITVTATGPGGAAVADSPWVVPVSFQINAGTISADKTSLNFTQLAGSTTPPQAQTINITGAPQAINYAVTAAADNGGTWLTATPANGTTPGAVQVSVNAGTLPAGQYTGKVTITAPTPPGATGSPLVIPVTFNVVASQTLTASPNTVNFTFTAGAQQGPADQTVAIASSSGGAAPFTVKIDQGTGTWLSVDPTSGNTPSNLKFHVNPANLTAGKYTATVTLSSTASLTSTVITVTLNVTAPVPPVLLSIVNAASYAPGAVSPGENVTIFGTGLGPDTLAGAALTPTGALATTVAETTVTFDNVPAPIIYVSAKQTSVMVPYEVAGRPTTTVRVTYKGVTSDPITYNVIPVVPGIYTQNSQGTGPGSILNGVDLSVNGPTNPAAKGSAVAVYMTGEGVTQPTGTTGAVAGSSGNPLAKPVQNVTATVGGLPATVEYYGSAPGIVYGVMQVNVRLPANVPSGAQTLVISVGSQSTQTGVTVSVQ